MSTVTGPADTETRSAAEVLAWSRTLFAPALRDAVDTLPDSMRRIAGYHLGWLQPDGSPAGGNGGKALRPALTLLTAEAVGGRAEAALPSAVAIELVHNFSLLHDDVMDGDRMRRHRPTAWHVFGVGPAILTGDALLTLAFDVLARSGHPAATTAMRALSAAVLRLQDGQSADLCFERRDDVGLSECLRMATGKTAALLGCASELGALFAGAAPDKVARLREFGERLGLAFQFVDDLLGIWGDPAITGKPVHSDLASRKKSLPVVAALTSGTPEGKRLAAWFRKDTAPTDEQLMRVAALVERAGGRTWATTQADRQLALALRELPSVRAIPRRVAELTALARHATHRDR